MIKELARNALRLVPPNTIVPILSGPLKGSRWVFGSGAHTYWRGRYEPALAMRMSEVIKPRMICYDCGANTGYFTLLMARLVGESGHVFAFEPVPANAANARKNMEINRLHNVTVIEMALANQNGRARFSTSSNFSMGHLGGGGDLEVDTARIDSLGLPAPDVMKIDVEGAEALLIDGAESAIRASRPIIFMSLHLPIEDSRALADRIRWLGYTVVLSEHPYELEAIPL
jgi:FkbM family methyltransferase